MSSVSSLFLVFDTLCSQASPLVARWTFKDTPTTNPKGVSHWHTPKGNGTLGSIKSIYIYFCEPRQLFFFFLLSLFLRSVQCTHTLWVVSHSHCALKSLVPCKLWVKTQTWLIGQFLCTFTTLHMASISGTENKL